MEDRPLWRRAVTDFWDRMAAHRWTWWAVLSVVLVTIVSGLVDALTQDWLSRHVWNPVLDALRELVSQPVGFVLLAFLGWVALWVGFSFVRVSPLIGWLERRWKAPTQSDLERLGGELATLQQANRISYWQIQWRMDPPALGSVSPEEAVLARLAIGQLATVLEALHTAVKALTWEMLNHLSAGPDATPLTKESARLFHEAVVDPNRRLMCLAITPGKEDPRIALRACLSGYRVLREWILGYPSMLGKPLREFNTYSAWASADGQFFARLSELPTNCGLDEIRYFIELESRHGHPAALPPAVPAADRGVEMRLRQLSEAEREFLRLLEDESNPYNEPGNTLLAHAVYMAGEELARQGVFVQRSLHDTEPWTEVFSVPTGVMGILRRMVFSSSATVRDEVRLRLDRVAGTGSSGSGARSSYPR